MTDLLLSDFVRAAWLALHELILFAGFASWTLLIRWLAARRERGKLLEHIDADTRREIERILQERDTARAERDEARCLLAECQCQARDLAIAVRSVNRMVDEGAMSPAPAEISAAPRRALQAVRR